MSFGRASVFAAVACAAICGHVSASAQEVGTAAAVNPAAQARGAGGTRTIVIGNSISHRERIQTTSAGSVQLLFLDKTSMTVGPNSDLAIDEYVFDPASSSGKLAATLSKGVMRFVGGQISHAGNAQISTPTAVVGIRGGVGIIHPNSVYIGYGQGQVSAGGGTVTLGAGEFTQTAGGGAPPTSPGAPPAGFLQSVLASLQSKPGQGGGAPKSSAQVNRARVAASGSANGNIATAVYNVNWPATIWPEWLSLINQSIQTAAAQKPLIEGGLSGEPGSGVPQVPNIPGHPSTPGQSTIQLVGFTGGMVASFGANGTVGNPFPLFGTMSLAQSGSHSQANMTVASVGQQSQNSLLTGNIQFGSLDPNLPSGNITISQFNQFVGTATALAPAVNANNQPSSTINDTSLIQQQGVFVEVKPGSQLANSVSSALHTTLCQCNYTQWGLWDSRSLRPGPNNSSIDERAQMFWVAGRLPNAGEIPANGTATYTGHAIANIRNGSQEYISAGAFQNVVNFGTRSGVVSVTQFDATNYSGSVRFGSDPRFFSGALASTNMHGRSMGLTGAFFNGVSSPVGEMGGALSLSGPSYSGGGIFVGKMK